MRDNLHENNMRDGFNGAEFSTKKDAENYVLANPEKRAFVVESGHLMLIIFGENYEANK